MTETAIYGVTETAIYDNVTETAGYGVTETAGYDNVIETAGYDVIETAGYDVTETARFTRALPDFRKRDRLAVPQRL